MITGSVPEQIVTALKGEFDSILVDARVNAVNHSDREVAHLTGDCHLKTCEWVPGSSHHCYLSFSVFHYFAGRRVLALLKLDPENAAWWEFGRHELTYVNDPSEVKDELIRMVTEWVQFLQTHPNVCHTRPFDQSRVQEESPEETQPSEGNISRDEPELPQDPTIAQVQELPNQEVLGKIHAGASPRSVVRLLEGKRGYPGPWRGLLVSEDDKSNPRLIVKDAQEGDVLVVPVPGGRDHPETERLIGFLSSVCEIANRNYAQRHAYLDELLWKGSGNVPLDLVARWGR